MKAKRSHISPGHISLGMFTLLAIGLVLQLSGLELVLHEAAERDCTDADAGNGICVLCLAPAAVLGPDTEPPIPLPTVVPTHELCVTGDHQPPHHFHVQLVPGRSPPLDLPA